MSYGHSAIRAPAATCHPHRCRNAVSAWCTAAAPAAPRRPCTAVASTRHRTVGSTRNVSPPRDKGGPRPRCERLGRYLCRGSSRTTEGRPRCAARPATSSSSTTATAGGTRPVCSTSTAGPMAGSAWCSTGPGPASSTCWRCRRPRAGRYPSSTTIRLTTHRPDVIRPTVRTRRPGHSCRGMTAGEASGGPATASCPRPG